MSPFWPLQNCARAAICPASVFERQTEVPAQMVVAIVSIIASGWMGAIARFVVFFWTRASDRCSIGSEIPLTAMGRGR